MWQATDRRTNRQTGKTSPLRKALWWVTDRCRLSVVCVQRVACPWTCRRRSRCSPADAFARNSRRWISVAMICVCTGGADGGESIRSSYKRIANAVVHSNQYKVAAAMKVPPPAPPAFSFQCLYLPIADNWRQNWIMRWLTGNLFWNLSHDM